MSASVLYMSKSLDGYIAGPNDEPDNPGGDGFMRLHEWFGFTPDGDFTRPPGPVGELIDEMDSFGAIVAGRRTVEQVDHWAGDHHHGAPIFVASHRPPGPSVANYPLVTYVFGATGESSLKKAFAEQGLEPNVVFTARDADIIKTYVRMGMGVGIVAPMAYECQDQKDLTALSAAGLFPRVTTWLGFRRDSVLRRYMVDFIALFAPHLTPQLTRKAAQLTTQTEVDALFDEAQLPIRGGCDEAPGAVARP